MKSIGDPRHVLLAEADEFFADHPGKREKVSDMIVKICKQQCYSTGRSACAIDDFIDDSKQALSMISWMAAQRGREEDKDTNRIALASFT